MTEEEILPQEENKAEIIAPGEAKITPELLSQVLKGNPDLSMGQLFDWIKNYINLLTR